MRSVAYLYMLNPQVGYLYVLRFIMLTSCCPFPDL